MSKTALYRHFGKDGGLLYVGISKNPFVRFQIHGQRSCWVGDVANMTIEWHPTRQVAEYYEDIAIKNESPAYNIKGNPINKITSIDTIKSGLYGSNGQHTLYIPLELNRATEKIVEQYINLKLFRNSKGLIIDILFAYSKQHEEFSKFVEEKSGDFGGKRRVVLLPYSGDIYNHLRSIEKNSDDFESTVEALFMFYDQLFN